MRQKKFEKIELWDKRNASDHKPNTNGDLRKSYTTIASKNCGL